MRSPRLTGVENFSERKLSSRLPFLEWPPTGCIPIVSTEYGDTLADRLKRGAIPVEESLTLAPQITEALEAAHVKGVIHRDLKPANIKVTPDGKVKVLDFILAKAFEGGAADPSVSNSPTLRMAATQQGMILATAAYISPERAKGLSVDKRTDIWALGAVLYEMLTGKLVFQAEDVSETLAAILMKEPDWEAIASAPPAVTTTIQRCLQKDQKQRIRVRLSGAAGRFRN